MLKKITLQEYINFLQSQIDNGKIDGSLPVAVCSHANPIGEYWLLDADSTTVLQYSNLAIITH